MALAGSMFMKAEFANIIIISACVLAIVWAIWNVYSINKIEMTTDNIKVNVLTDEEKQTLE